MTRANGVQITARASYPQTVDNLLIKGEHYVEELGRILKHIRTADRQSETPTAWSQVCCVLYQLGTSQVR